jgi:DNA repair photolyase
LSVLTLFDPWKNPLCTCPDKYQVSPYTGCGHCCVYCYITAYIPDAFNPRPKKNFIPRLIRDLQHANPALNVSISNSSDPYTPQEAELGLTREALRILISSGFGVQVITKSDLVARDADLLRRGRCSVSITITSLDEHKAAKIEPGAPPPERRLKALRFLSKIKVPCSVRIDPVIPKINDEEAELLVKEAAMAGALHIVASTYKAKQDSLSRLMKASPQASALREAYLFDGERHGRALYLRRAVRENILGQIYEASKKYGLTFGVCREGFRFASEGICDGSHLIKKGCEKDKNIS